MLSDLRSQHSRLRHLTNLRDVGEIRSFLVAKLRETDPIAASQDSRWMLEKLLDRSYSKILADSERTLSLHDLERLDQWIEDYQNHKPLAYILQSSVFMGLELKVNPCVLIPRSDTETMVEMAAKMTLQSLRTKRNFHSEPYKILDLGTGSGAIAIALFKIIQRSYADMSHLQFVAVDKSVEALEIAEENAHTHQAKINFHYSDWFSALKEDEKFDLIISNPPYVDKQEQTEYSLSYEPSIALYAENFGMSEILKISVQAKKHLSSDGVLMVEHGHAQAQSTQDIFLHQEWSNYQTCQDLSKCQRFIVAYA